MDEGVGLCCQILHIPPCHVRQFSRGVLHLHNGDPAVSPYLQGYFTLQP